MRVLHILEATQGGTRRHVLDLLPHLQAQGFQCELIYSPRRYPHFAADARQLELAGVRTWAVSMTPEPHAGTNGAALLALARHIRAHRPDVLPCHSTVAGLLGRTAAAIVAPGLPTVYTPHCIAFDTGMSPLRRRGARLLEGLLAPRTSRFIAVSHHEAALLRGTVAPAHKVSVIHNGIDLAAFDTLGEAGRDMDDIPCQEPATFRVGCFGRLSRQKNQELLLRAWGQVAQRVPGARLMLVGDGDQECRLRQIASNLQLADSVDWLGDRPEARGLYRQCDVIVQPSRWEGCPYSVLEAMAAGRPVLATPVGGVPELTGPGPLLSSRNPIQLAERIIELALSPAKRATEGQAMRGRIESRFTAAMMVRQTAAVYRSL